MRRSLRWRIIVSYIALVVVSMLGLSIILFLYIRDTDINSLKSNLQSNSHLLAQQAAPLVASGSPSPALDTLVKRFGEGLNARVTIIRPDGVVLADSEFDRAIMENHGNRPEVSSAVGGSDASQIRFSSTAQTELLYVATPIYNDNHTLVGVARLAVSLAQVNANLTVVRQTMLAISLLASLIGILLAFLLSRFTMRPLQDFTRSIIKLGNPEVASANPPAHLDEIEQLNYAFNQLMAQLNAQIMELKNEREKLSAVLANMNDGVLIVNAECIVELINPAAKQIFKVTDDLALGRSLTEVVRNHQLVEMWNRSMATGRQQTITFEASPDRTFIQSIATPLTYSMPGSTLMVFQDLTRVRRLEMVRRDFVSNVSHELRTPLASLKALTETLQEGALEDPPAARRFLLRMEHEIDNLTQMVHELLELSRIESGRVPLEKFPFQPYELVSQAAERMQLQAERAGLQLNIAVDEDLPDVIADAGRMQQVLVNLLHNAIKFTQPGGQITVGAYPQPKRVVFFVRDTGVGIEPNALPRIFERFYKADRARSGGGTGLGLSISRHLVEAHNGRIWAESIPGKGSTFYFSLPSEPV